MNVQMAIEPVRGKEDVCPVFVQLTDFWRTHETDPRAARTPARVSEGDAPLRWVAGPFRQVVSTKTQAEWVARLAPRYSACEAQGWMKNKDGKERVRAASYLALQFVGGELRLTLDLSKRDGESVMTASGTTPRGRPFWTWQPVQN